MTTRDAIVKELQEVPEPLLAAILDYVRLLRERSHQGLETAVASEPVLARDWTKPEEDSAWADL
jgi:hypothetical protein